MESYKDDDASSDGEALLSLSEKDSDSTAESHSATRRWLNTPLWFVTSIVLLLVCTVQFVLQAGFLFRDKSAFGSYREGFSTELDDLKPSLQLHQTRFDNAFIIRDNLTMYMKVDPTTPKYTRSAGATQQELDIAWNELLGNRYVKLKDSEISWLDSDQGLPDLTYNDDPDLPGYFAGPDFMHSLHCLNVLRKRIDPEHYSHEWAADYSASEALHLDHCMEQLRQQILCHGDITPVTIKPIMGRHGETFVLLGETERMHTCRNGLALRDRWMARGEESGFLRHS